MERLSGFKCTRSMSNNKVLILDIDSRLNIFFIGFFVNILHTLTGILFNPPRKGESSVDLAGIGIENVNGYKGLIPSCKTVFTLG